MLRPVHVLAFQAGDVTLARAQVPTQLIQRLTFGIHFGGYDLLMFFMRYGAFLLVVDGGPLPAGNNDGGQPAHIHREVVNLPQKRIG